MTFSYCYTITASAFPAKGNDSTGLCLLERTLDSHLCVQRLPGCGCMQRARLAQHCAKQVWTRNQGWKASYLVSFNFTKHIPRCYLLALLLLPSRNVSLRAIAGSAELTGHSSCCNFRCSVMWACHDPAAWKSAHTIGQLPATMMHILRHVGNQA